MTLKNELRGLDFRFNSQEYVDRIYVFYNHKSASINYEKNDRVWGGLLQSGDDQK